MVKKYKNHSYGFSLIESLIAMFIMAIVLLGLGELQLEAMQSNQQAFFENQAVEQLEMMTDIVRITHGNYSAFLNEWNEDNKNLLPQGKGKVARQGNQYNISLQWLTGKSHLWKCDSAPKKDFACIYIKFK